MPVIVALGGFIALVAAFMAVTVALVLGMRLLDRLI